jgi:hypothetical protein
MMWIYIYPLPHTSSWRSDRNNFTYGDDDNDDDDDDDDNDDDDDDDKFLIKL